MSAFGKVTGEDLAYFRSLLPGRVFAGEEISPDYDHDEMTEYVLGKKGQKPLVHYDYLWLE